LSEEKALIYNIYSAESDVVASLYIMRLSTHICIYIYNTIWIGFKLDSDGSRDAYDDFPF